MLLHILLLPNAQEQIYTKAFRILRDKVAETFAHEDEPLGHMSVAHWHFDFERAAYNALQLKLNTIATKTKMPPTIEYYLRRVSHLIGTKRDGV